MILDPDDGDIEQSPDQKILFHALDVIDELEREAVPFGDQWREVCMNLRTLIGYLWEMIENASTDGQRDSTGGHDPRPSGAV